MPTIDKSPLEGTTCFAFIETPPSFKEVDARHQEHRSSTASSVANNNNNNRRYIPRRSMPSSAATSITAQSQQQPIRPFNPRESMKNDFIKHQQDATFLPFMDQDEAVIQDKKYHQEHPATQHQFCSTARQPGQQRSSSASTIASSASRYYHNNNQHVQPPFATNLPVPFEEIQHVAAPPTASSVTMNSSRSSSAMMPPSSASPPNTHQQQHHQQHQHQNTTDRGSRRRQYQQEQREELFGGYGGGNAADDSYSYSKNLAPSSSRPKTATTTSTTTVRSASAGIPTHPLAGNWHNHKSNIRLAGPENTEPMQNNRIQGIPRMGSCPYRQQQQQQRSSTASSKNTSFAVQQQEKEAEEHPQNNTNTNKMGPSSGPTYQQHPTNNPNELRRILSQESDAIRRSQRFSCTPRGYTGDHLKSGGILRSDGQTSLTECMNTARGVTVENPPPPTTLSAAAHHRHRPQNVIHDAFVESESPSLEEEFQNAWHFGKKKHVASKHVDAYRDQHVNLLQPWAGGCGGGETKSSAAMQSQKKRPLSAVNNGVRSTAHEAAEKSYQLRQQGKPQDFVSYGEEGVTKDTMRERMLRGSTTSFW